jgi:hypothetical protein
MKLIGEICIHLLMPYTFTNFDWTMMILGSEFRYSLNTFLVVLSTLRFYVLFKFIRGINEYSSTRSARIINFFNVKKIYIFLYRSNMFYRGFITIIFLWLFVLYMFTIIFKLLENDKSDNVFRPVENCMWFLIVTMTTSKIFITLVGFGDLTPTTLLGRIIAVFACIFGIFALSLLIYYILISVQMNEWEIYAYQDICNITTKKNERSRNYFEDYIVYKLSKRRSHLTEFMENANRLRTNSHNNLFFIRSRIMTTYTPLEFCEHIIDIWYRSSTTTIRKMQEIVSNLYPELVEFARSTSQLIVVIKNSKVLMFKLYNLFKIYTLLQNSFRIESKYRSI